MVEAICAELVLRKSEENWQGELHTVYLGGGTPSLLEPVELTLLFDTIRQHYTIRSGAEITLEANPEDLTPGQLAAFVTTGINRLSLGVQSFDANDLTWMNRAHSPEQARACVQLARNAGIDQVSIDLIFGLPGSDLPTWQQQLEAGIALAPDHFSLYALSIEQPSVVKHWVEKGAVDLPDDEVVTQQFVHAHTRLAALGYQHYELSSFARPGSEAQHNGAYWEGLPYLGLGPSAHSFDGQRRSWNIAHNVQYMQALAQGNLPTEAGEVLSDVNRCNEYMMTQLRLATGLDTSAMKDRFGYDLVQQHQPKFDQWIQMGWMWQTENRVGFHPRGWLLSDNLVAELFV